jgi:hypothetical protein
MSAEIMPNRPPETETDEFYHRILDGAGGQDTA